MQICEDARKSGETVIRTSPKEEESKTEYLIFFIVSESIRMTGEKVPDKDIHISLEVFLYLKIICLQLIEFPPVM